MKYQTDFKIGDETYVITHFPATKAARYMTRLIKLLGAPFATMMAAKKGASLEQVLPLAVAELASRMEEDEVIQLLKDLCGAASFKGQPLYSAETAALWESHFQGRLGDLFKIVREVVRWNYADFFTVLSVASKANKETDLEARSKSPSI